MPTYDVTKVLVGQADTYTAPVGTSKPADTVQYGTAWSSPWAPIGATEEGVSYTVSTETNDINIEEQSLPVAKMVTSKGFRVIFAMSEDTLENAKLAFGGGTLTTTAAGTGQIGKKTLVLSDTLDEIAVGFDSKNSFGFFRRIVIPRVLSLGDVTVAHRRAANNRVFNVELHAICRPQDIDIVEKTANATA